MTGCIDQAADRLYFSFLDHLETPAKCLPRWRLRQTGGPFVPFDSLARGQTVRAERDGDASPVVRLRWDQVTGKICLILVTPISCSDSSSSAPRCR